MTCPLIYCNLKLDRFTRSVGVIAYAGLRSTTPQAEQLAGVMWNGVVIPSIARELQVKWGCCAWSEMDGEDDDGEPAASECVEPLEGFPAPLPPTPPQAFAFCPHVQLPDGNPLHGWRFCRDVAACAIDQK